MRLIITIIIIHMITTTTTTTMETAIITNELILIIIMDKMEATWTKIIKEKVVIINMAMKILRKNKKNIEHFVYVSLKINPYFTFKHIFIIVSFSFLLKNGRLFVLNVSKWPYLFQNFCQIKPILIKKSIISNKHLF